MFCPKCGNQIPDGEACPVCAANEAAQQQPQQPQQQYAQPQQQYAQPQQPQQQYAQPQYAQPVAASNSANTIGLICGISGLVIVLLGGIMFGVIGALIGTALCVVGIVMGINAKKQTGGAKGSGAFVCGLIGAIFGVIFAAGCGICGSCSAGYGCYGCVGSSCKLAGDTRNSMRELEGMFNDLYDDWDF